MRPLNGVMKPAPDVFVERVVRYTGDEDQVWQAVTDFGWAVRDFAVKKHGRLKMLRDGANPRRVFAGLGHSDSWKLLTPVRTRVSESGVFLFRGRELHLSGRATGLFVIADGHVSSEDEAVFFCFANDGVTQTGGAAMRVVVCDGPFVIEPSRRGLTPGLGISVVVANGDVRFTQTTSVTDCLILAAGDVHIAEGCTIAGSTILAGGRIHLPPKGPVRDSYSIRDSRLEERVPNTLNPFQFVELSQVGLAVQTADGGVRVEKAEVKKPFAAAGVRKGDVVAAVDGKKVESVAGFRKQIRTAFVQGDCTLTVRRGAETKEIAVRFPD